MYVRATWCPHTHSRNNKSPLDFGIQWIGLELLTRSRDTPEANAHQDYAQQATNGRNAHGSLMTQVEMDDWVGHRDSGQQAERDARQNEG